MSTAVSLDPDLAPAAAASPSDHAASVESVLESGLAQVVPGFTLLDRTLEIADRTHVHLVGVDRSGALVLVALAPGDGETAPVRALESIEFVERNREPLLRHLKSNAHEAGRLDGSRPTRFLVVADLFSERTRRRLTPLVALGVEAFELKSLRSQGRQTTFLHRVVGSTAESSNRPEQELTPEHARLAEILRHRLSGLDDRVESVRTGQGIDYRVDGEPVAEIALPAGSTASGRVPGGIARRLDNSSALDEFVGEVVDNYVRRHDATESFGDEGMLNGSGSASW